MNVNLRAADIGFGGVKGMSASKKIEHPSVVGDFRPIRFNSGMDKFHTINNLCIEYQGKKLFVGDIAHRQSTPRVTLGDERFIEHEGMALMITALALLGEKGEEEIKLVTGLPVNSFKKLKNKYRNALEGRHSINLLQPDGKWGVKYNVTIAETKIIPQPVGTIFWAVLGEDGNINNMQYASGKIAVVDIGAYTVDLCQTSTLEFIDRESISFNDIGILSAYQELSQKINSNPEIGIEIPTEKIEVYIKNGGVKVAGKFKSIESEKNEVFSTTAKKIASRIKNSWRNIWDLDRILITGGGSAILGRYLSDELENLNNIEICSQGSFTNCMGYYRFGQRKRVWENE